MEGVCKAGLELPEVQVGKAYDVPALRVRGSLMAWRLTDRGAMAVKVDAGERDALCAARPGTFSVTDEYRNFPVVVVRLADVGDGDVERLLRLAWRLSAPPSLVTAHDERSPNPSVG